MGEVWRARDTRLGRDVALKVLPEDLARNAERRSRLEQEARLLASLNHPSIAALHDVLDDDGSPVLVMEVVEGETLAERLSRGPLPLKTALALALPIAEALEAAHERGILHRDLKPSNVKLTPEGGVKVLDFGLAKALDPDGGEVSSSVATIPKLVEKTESGVAVGTAPYMSPEQARGERVDKRTDVWAFGCILFEMLTGRRAFPGATRSDSIAAVLTREPGWGSLPEETPLALLRVLKRCLQKDPRERQRDIADVRLELKEINSAAAPQREALPRRRSKSWALAIVFLVSVVGLAVAFWFLRAAAPPTPDLRKPRFQLTLPRGVRLPTGGFTVHALSPDGAQITFVGCASAYSCQLYLRGETEIDAVPLQGTEGAIAPFFSPDGRWIAFGARGQLKKIDVKTRAVVGIANTPRLRGGSWGEDGTILFSRGRGGLLRVSAEGGEVQEITQVDPDRGELDHRWLQILPGGGSVLFDVAYETFNHDVAVANLETGEKRILVENAGCPKYVSGHLLFGRDGIVYGAPFDIDRAELLRPPVPVLEGVFMWSSPGESESAAGEVYYDVTRNGTLLFSPRDARLPRRTLVLVDRDGGRKPLSGSLRAYSYPLFSPDGRRIAVAVENDVGRWRAMVVDIASDAWTVVGGDVGGYFPEGWMPDSQRLLLAGSGGGLALAPLDGSASPTTLEPGEAQNLSVVPDGSAVLFGRQLGAAQWDIWRLPLADRGVAEPWLATENSESLPSVSPDGRFVAYQSNDSGRFEIYVRAYSGSGGRHLVSTNGGVRPRWSPTGGEIFFLSQRSLWTTAVRTSPTFAADPPRKLFDLPDEIAGGWDAGGWDVSPDGQHFVTVELDPFELRPLDLVVVPGWVEETTARVAAAK
jgi:serine/threonine-protein kinase